MEQIPSGQQHTGNFMRHKIFIEKLFSYVTDYTLEALKKYMESLAAQISRKEGELSSYTDIKSLLCECREGKGKTVLHFAAARGDLQIFKYLLSLGADLNAQDNEQNTPFFTAVHHSNFKLIKYLVEECKVDAAQKRNNDLNALHIAAMHGDMKLLKYLIEEQKLNVNEDSQFGTALKQAAAHNQIQALHYLLEKGADVNIGANNVIPHALLLVTDQSLTELVALLLKHGANVNTQDESGNSCLTIAAEKGDINTVKLLVEHGADANYQLHGKTPAQLAFENHKNEVLEFLEPLTAIPVNRNVVVAPEPALLPAAPVQKDSEQAIKLKDEGNALFKEERYAEALQKYESAIQQDNTQVVLYSNLAACLNKLKQYKKALEACKKAREIDVKFIKIYYREGEAYMGLEEYGDAAASFWEGWRLEPSSTTLKFLFEEARAKGQAKQ